ncbi:FAD/NAD(P)-binding domain-containing protein, partial [Mycena floridula]
AVIQGENSSRALAVHAPTLEALDTIGCAEELINQGIKSSGMEVSTRYRNYVNLKMDPISKYTPFPFILIVPQSTTEAVLLKRLESFGVTVHRPYRASGMKTGEQGLEVSFESGQTIRAKYVVGADGAKSVIRATAGVGFADPQGAVTEDAPQLVLADLIFSAAPQLPRDRVKITVGSTGFVLTIPLPESFRREHNLEPDQIPYRVVVQVDHSRGAPPSKPSAEFMQTYIDELGPVAISSDPSTNPNPIHISKVLWSSRFRAHAAIAERFCIPMLGDQGKPAGVVMLVGDAAHIHSPAGGQGMNLGLRDAIGLGPVLAKHIKAATGGNEDLLTYAAFRKSRALNIISLTKSIMRSAKLIGYFSTWPIDIAYWALKVTTALPFVANNMAWQASGLGNK